VEFLTDWTSAVATVRDIVTRSVLLDSHRL
jgi:hypothetical protein